MNEKGFDSGHVVLPIYHAASGEVHDIAVPHDIPIADLHDALSDYYHDEPTAQGAVENSPAFRQQAKAAWDKANGGINPNVEAGFDVGRTGQMGPIQTNWTAKGSLPTDRITINSNSLGAVHTHPDKFSSEPSQPDRDAAIKAHKTVWLVSRDGLYSIDPAGKVQKVFDKSDWMKK